MQTLWPYLLPYVCAARAAPRRRSATTVVSKPVSASRRVLSVTWRRTYCLGLRRLDRIILAHLFMSIFIGARQVLTEPEGHVEQ
jgi:hypothetical protein